MWNKDYLQYAANQFKVIVCPSPFRQGRKPRRKCYARAVCSVHKDKGEMQHFHSHMGRNLTTLEKLNFGLIALVLPIARMTCWNKGNLERSLGGAHFEVQVWTLFASWFHDLTTITQGSRRLKPSQLLKKGNWEEITLTISLYWVGGLQINVK